MVSQAFHLTSDCSSFPAPSPEGTFSRGREGHTSPVSALTAFADPATDEIRLVSGSDDKILRVWDASQGCAALHVVCLRLLLRLTCT